MRLSLSEAVEAAVNGDLEAVALAGDDRYAHRAAHTLGVVLVRYEVVDGNHAATRFRPRPGRALRQASMVAFRHTGR